MPRSDAAPLTQRLARIRSRLPRPELILLAAAAGLTAGAKLVVVHRYAPTRLLRTWLDLILADVVFFSASIMGIWLLYAWRPRPIAARGALGLAAAALLWAVVNAGWLLATGVQLQPGILLTFFRDPGHFWPLAASRVTRNLHYMGPLAVLLVAALTWFVWRVVRPVRMQAGRRHHAKRALAASILLVSALAGQWAGGNGDGLGYESQVLRFSSHWYALVSAVMPARNEPSHQTRHLPRVGEREIGLPETPTAQLPNVVLVLLESVSWAATSLGHADAQTTPYLTRLASEGVEFQRTRVPVSHTTKAFWSTLTGTVPDVHPDYAEAILADEPYEGLPSILRRRGYRSAFFEMSMGMFESAPALFANLAFDRAWFRENLEDPSAYIGYMGGDDFRMIQPAFEWVDSSGPPFLLMMITSISHDPYEVPAWFEPPAEGRRERYRQTVRYTDQFLARVDDELRRRGLTENTILCVMGDHGTSMRTDEHYGRWEPREEVIRVPWVIRWPAHLEAGRRVDWPCSQLDVTPTILRLIGFDIERAGFEGRDALTPGDPDRRLYFSSWFPDSPFGFVEGSRKYVYWPYTEAVFQCDLEADPNEASPKRIDGPAADHVITEALAWRRASRIIWPAKRFRERRLFEHWRSFAAGRRAWSYYVPRRRTHPTSPDAPDE